MSYMSSNFDRSDSVADRDWLWCALDYAVDGVLADPTDRELVLAVEEMLERKLPARYEQRFFDAIVTVFDGAVAIIDGGGFVTQAEGETLVRRAVSVYGLC